MSTELGSNRSRRRWLTAGAASIAIVGVTMGTSENGSPADRLRPDAVDSDQRASSSVLLGEGAGRLPATTAEEWVTHGDHAVVVRVVGERALPLSETDRQRGEGMILREVELRVEQVLWSASSHTSAAPSSFSWVGFGWQYKGEGAKLREMGVSGSSRLELGHSYVLVIDWIPSSCAEEARDEGSDDAGSWSGLDGDGILPFDSGTVGIGEFEGTISKSEARTPATTDDGSVGSATRGLGADALRTLLSDTARSIPGRAPQSC
jgi:hypothetical protein